MKNDYLDNELAGLEQQSHKGRISVIMISIITAIVLGCGCVFSYCVYHALALKTSLTVIIDPVVVTKSGENHLENARAFTFSQNGKQNYDTHIETKLSEGQSMEYRFTFENSGETNVEVTLNYTLDKQENIMFDYLKYSETQKENEIFFGVIKPSEKMRVVVGVKVVDAGLDAFATGKFSLLLDDKGDRA